MIAIRVIIEVIIFIYMMGLSIGLRKKKIKRYNYMLNQIMKTLFYI